MDEVTQLALQAGSGDPAAFTRLVRRTQAEVWRLCAHLVGPQDADDLTQDTYLRIHRSLPTFRGESSARTWILSIARRTCADSLRTTVRLRRLSERVGNQLATRSDTTPDPAGASDLRSLVAALPSDRRDAFVLTQVLGLPYLEAADVCGCPVGTIRSRVARAREELVAQLAPERLGEGGRLAEGGGS